MADLDFSLSQPVRIEFGVGKVDHLEELVKIYGNVPQEAVLSGTG